MGERCFVFPPLCGASCFALRHCAAAILSHVGQSVGGRVYAAQCMRPSVCGKSYAAVLPDLCSILAELVQNILVGVPSKFELNSHLFQKFKC